jgi:hypothetical protein
MKRAYLKQFLDFVNNNSDRIKLGVWTYSEREYAEDITDEITKHYNLDENPFIIKYGTEDIKDHNIPKSLNKIWKSKLGKKFNKMNTILIDDRFSNLCHDTNKKNSIVTKGFEPFGYIKERQPLTEKNYEEAIKDTMLLSLMDIIVTLFNDFDGCSEEEIADALKTEPVFQKKRLERRR